MYAACFSPLGVGPSEAGALPPLSAAVAPAPGWGLRLDRGAQQVNPSCWQAVCEHVQSTCSFARPRSVVRHSLSDSARDSSLAGGSPGAAGCERCPSPHLCGVGSVRGAGVTDAPAECSLVCAAAAEAAQIFTRAASPPGCVLRALQWHCSSPQYRCIAPPRVNCPPSLKQNRNKNEQQLPQAQKQQLTFAGPSWPCSPGSVGLEWSRFRVCSGASDRETPNFW